MANWPAEYGRDTVAQIVLAGGQPATGSWTSAAAVLAAYPDWPRFCLGGWVVRVLVSGTSVAGPVLTYWLHRYSFEVTVVEQAPALRHADGHAVDLFRPALEIIDRTGLSEQVAAAATGTARITLYREGVATPVRIDLTRLLAAVSERHVEIMR
jgi:hypothetical protein